MSLGVSCFDDANRDLKNFIQKFQLQRIEKQLHDERITTDFLLSLSSAQIEEISSELAPHSGIQQKKFKYAVQQLKTEREAGKTQDTSHQQPQKNGEKPEGASTVVSINQKDDSLLSMPRVPKKSNHKEDSSSKPARRRSNSTRSDQDIDHRKKCFLCRGSGHYAAQCSSRPRSRPGIESKTNKTNSHSHKSNSTTAYACFGCGKEGHKISVCPQRMKCLRCGKSKIGVATQKCFCKFKDVCHRCRGKGHWAKDCPSKQDKCKRCGSAGHKTKDCNEHRNNRSSNVESDGVRVVESPSKQQLSVEELQRNAAANAVEELRRNAAANAAEERQRNAAANAAVGQKRNLTHVPGYYKQQQLQSNKRIKLESDF